MDLLTVLRVVISLAVVFGALWVFQRRVAKRSGGRGRKQAQLTVLGRVNLGGKASAVVVETGGTRLVLGVTEHGVSVLSSAASAASAASTSAVAPAELPSSPTPPVEPSTRGAVAAPIPLTSHVAGGRTGLVQASAEADADSRAELDADTESIRLPSAEELAADWAARSATVSPIAPKQRRVTLIRDAAGNPATLAGVREGFDRIRGAIGR